MWSVINLMMEDLLHNCRIMVWYNSYIEDLEVDSYDSDIVILEESRDYGKV